MSCRDITEFRDLKEGEKFHWYWDTCDNPRHKTKTGKKEYTLEGVDQPFTIDDKEVNLEVVKL